MKNKQGKQFRPGAFLFITSLCNCIFSFLIIKVLSFTIFVLPLFLILSLLFISIGALSTKRITEISSIQSKKLIVHLIAIYIITTLLFSCILMNTHMISRDFSISLTHFIRFLLFYLVLLSPFYIYWGRIEYLSFKLYIHSSQQPSLFYCINLLGILCGILYDFYFFTFAGIIGSVIILIFILLIYGVINHHKSEVIIVCILCMPIFFIGKYYDHTLITWCLSEKDELNLKNNLFFIPNPLMQKDYQKKYRVIYQNWNRFCHFSLIRFNDHIFGAYNGYPYWGYSSGMDSILYDVSAETIPIMLAGRHKKIAIIGSGGGFQVAMTTQYTPQQVYAIEIIPDVMNTLTGSFASFNDYLYQKDNIVPVTEEGSHFIANYPERFDLIMSVNTETIIGSIRDLFEPSQLFHTYESFQKIYSHLEDGGIFSIKKTMHFDDANHYLLFNYFYTLQQAGFIVKGYIDPVSKAFVLIGFKKIIRHPEVLTIYENQVLKNQGQIITSIPPHITPKRIDQNNLHLGGIIYYIIGKPFFIKTIVVLIIFSLVIAFSIGFLLKNHQDKGLKWRSFLIGANFILIENLIIHQLRFYTPNPLEAYYYGLFAFTGCAIVANFVHDRHIIKNQASLLSFAGLSLLSYYHFIFIIPAICLSGIFFKVLFIKYKSKTLLIFSYDMIGMCFGGFLYLIVGYAMRFDVLMILMLAVFWLTFLTINKNTCLLKITEKHL